MYSPTVVQWFEKNPYVATDLSDQQHFNNPILCHSSNSTKSKVITHQTELFLCSLVRREREKSVRDCEYVQYIMYQDGF